MGHTRFVFQSQVTDELRHTQLELVVFIYVVWYAPPRIMQHPVLQLRTDGVLPYSEVNNFYIIASNLNNFIPMFIAIILEHFIPFIITQILMF